MRKSILLALAVAALASSAFCARVTIGRGRSLDWTVPGNLPPGAEYHLIYEDPVTHGIEALVRFPSGYSTDAHQHSHDETMVVLRGKLVLVVAGKATTLRAGDYALIPAGTPHSFKAPGWGGCEMVMTVSGPYDVLPATPAR